MSDMQTKGVDPNVRLVKKFLWVALGSFAFAFAMVPMYRIACEKVFGIKASTTAVSEAEASVLEPDLTRTITVSFDASVDPALPWQFKPSVRSMQVHPGVPSETIYLAQNSATMTTVGQAAPSVAPAESSLYFQKTECFCFTQQLLHGGEQREMPVRFVIDPRLPREVKDLTLSYRFYLQEDATQAAQSATPVVTETATESHPS